MKTINNVESEVIVKKTVVWKEQRDRARIEKQRRGKPGCRRARKLVLDTRSTNNTDLGVSGQMLRNVIRISRASTPKTAVKDKYTRQKTG